MKVARPALEAVKVARPALEAVKVVRPALEAVKVARPALEAVKVAALVVVLAWLPPRALAATRAPDAPHTLPVARASHAPGTLAATPASAESRTSAAPPPAEEAGSGPDDWALDYRSPVPGRVLAGFSPPKERWGSGHRGLDLAAEAGEPVRAAAEGEVAFAGLVAGQMWVTVAHADGVRTSYGPLASVAIETGTEVRRGQVLGHATGGHTAGDHARGNAIGGDAADHASLDPPEEAVALHWSARRGDDYLDPRTLLSEPGDWVPTLIGPGRQEATDIPPRSGYRGWQGRRGPLGRLGVVEGSRRARGPGWELPPNPNHVIGVSGVNSDDGRTPMDLSHLGYAIEDITYLSYAGRREAAPPDPRDPRRDQLPYGRDDTWNGVWEAALHLREQLIAQQARHPGQAVDLVGHSMGGVVVLTYLLALHDPADPALPPVAHAVTIAAPLQGADLASALLDASEAAPVRTALDAISAATGQAPHDAPSLQDLAVGSVLLQQLAHDWERAREHPWSSPLATGTQILTIGGSHDVVVPEHRTDLPGAGHVVLPGGHDRVRLTEASREVVHAFLADQPVPGAAGGLGSLLSHPVGGGERVVGEVLGRLDW